MYQVPDYNQTVSMKLSEVLADIGVDERIVMKTRRSWLLIESITNITYQLRDGNCLTYFFGSQSEGTTTKGMQSDLDQLYCNKALPMIQDWSDWIPGLYNLLMIQDNSVSPGYCLLQVLRPDAPLPFDGESDQFLFKDRTGKLFLKNYIVHVTLLNIKREIHGPAGVLQRHPGYFDNDFVLALHCTTWPQQARQWLDQQGEGQWPSAEMKQYCSRTGCFVVGVGCSGSEHEQLEWRISTSLAERCLMFNLNITQIRCYVLMKIILKTFINPLFKDVISSFMCKTVLFHCISNTHSNIWRENNLLSCLSLCLYLLYNNIINENCPHFIIPGNNLMRGKISPAVKPYILEILSNIINSEGVALLGIKCDDLGSRLHLKFNNLCTIKTSDIISGTLLFNLAKHIYMTLKEINYHLKDSSPNEAVEILKNYVSKTINGQYEGLDKTASNLIAPIYCTTLGSVLASLNIYHYNTVSADALKLISLGLNTDVASSKLKLASILYCVQEIQKADSVLSEIERRYDLQIVEPVCSCHDFEKKTPRQGFFKLCDIHNEEILQYTTASCVIFLQCEIHCVPNELRYEMFRSTQEDRMFRTEEDNKWMDCAVVDSLPYLYFLQYKVYSHLGRHDQKQAALFKLIRTIKEEPNLGHRETALNILGKCMEQEGRAGDAFQCYSMSLNIRGRNNAAKIHIATLLSVLINARR
ncbi:uncharacterized protein LOC132733873 [Ruditapes philippinarum]|uniref:uncharacterized protein LOC132733873 n=1 Tax=Ruditapes philippinarum TaxID=129788 RepID=UPI00295C2788|nr:uncharacterized protein LOC132733873 [Ruditapes philippinarum]XP_060576582.1 uncharacterized protein LOC132733873 [Ruditapes philippinarum]